MTKTWEQLTDTQRAQAVKIVTGLGMLASNAETCIYNVNDAGEVVDVVEQNPFGEVISSYSRQQAIEDGFLVDVSTVAKEAGIKFPTALTNAVWAEYVEVPAGVEAQDEQGRLWDILWMFRNAARHFDGDTLRFQLYVRNDNRSEEHTSELQSLAYL